MQVTMLDSKEWSKLSSEAHALCFGEERPASMDCIDFALLVTENDKPVAYMTCRKLDSESVYMQYGGSFPESRDTIKSFKAYQAMIDFLSERFLRASTLIENTNKPMLKFAMKVGLLISGVRYFKGSILLEHFIEWNKVNI